MRKLFLIPAIFSLALSVACGGSGSSSGNGGFGSGGSNGFSAASLSGQYAYQVSGFDFTNNVNLPFKETGVFVADGKGNITSGTDDFAEGTSAPFSDPTTGTYTVASDGTGSINLNISNSTTITLALTVATSSKLLLTVPLIGGTNTVTGSGVALKQDTTALSTIPSGNFAFGGHTLSTTLGSASIAGAFTVTNGVIAGNQDTLQGGTLTQHTLTGLFNTPDTTGRGSATFTNELSATSTYNYYVIDANTLFLFSTVTGVSGVGRAEKQSTSTFAASSLTGNYAFGSKGDTSTLDSVNSAGRFTAGGDGTITAGAFDSEQDGTVASNIAFTGTYTVAANGRTVLSLIPASGSAIEDIAYMVSPTRAFFLVNDPAKFEDGTIDGQSGTLSNSSFTGAYAFATDGFSGSDSFDRLGTLTPDGAGNLKLDYVVTEPGLSSSTNNLTGTYSVASNGRVTVTVPQLNFVFYLISGTDGYIVQVDPQTQMAGSFSKQQ